MTMTREQVADALERDEGVESHTGRSTVEPELLKAAIAHLRQPAPTAQGELPPLPEPIGEIIGRRLTPVGTNEFWGWFERSYTGDERQRVFTADQMQAYARAAVATAQAAAGVPEGFVLVNADLLNSFPELNLSNYDEDDVADLNAWGIDLVKSAAAPSAPAQSDSADARDAALFRWLEAKGDSLYVEWGGGTCSYDGTELRAAISASTAKGEQTI